MSRTILRATLLASLLLVTGAAVVAAQDTEPELTIPQAEQAVLVGVRSDVNLPAGEEVDAVVVVQADGVIEGTTGGLVIVDADVTVGSGATVDDVFAVGGTLTVEAGATVDELAYIDTTIDTAPGTVANTRDIRVDITGAMGWAAVGFAAFLFVIWIGWAIWTLVAALLMVAFGTSQARRAAWLIGNHPLKVLGAGLLMLILPWILFVLLAVTVIGLPVAFGLAIAWGIAVFLGYLVAGLWVGERVLRSSRNATRPYAAAFVGVLILLLLSWFPLVTFIATWFGLGAVTMAGWRVLRGGGRPAQAMATAPAYGQPPAGYQPPPGYAPPGYAPPGYGQPGYPTPPYTQPPDQWPPQDRWPPQQPPASWPG